MGTHAVANQMQIVCSDTPGMLGQVSDQLCYALCAKPRCPFHLFQARFLHQRTIIDDDDVIVAFGEKGVSHVGARGIISSSAESVHDYFRWVRPVELRLIKRVLVVGVDKVWGFLCAPENSKEYLFYVFVHEILKEC